MTSQKFEIKHKRTSWPGWSDSPPGHRITVYCENVLLEEKDNLSEVDEYLLLKKWKKRSRRPDFAELLKKKPAAFPLCSLCKKPIEKGGGSVWDISFCKQCDADGSVDQYREKKQKEQEEQQQEETRKMAEDEELRKRKVQLRLAEVRTWRLIAANSEGEFRLRGKTIAFVPYLTKWEHEIIEATLDKEGGLPV